MPEVDERSKDECAEVGARPAPILAALPLQPTHAPDLQSRGVCVSVCAKWVQPLLLGFVLLPCGAERPACPRDWPVDARPCAPRPDPHPHPHPPTPPHTHHHHHSPTHPHTPPHHLQRHTVLSRRGALNWTTAARHPAYALSRGTVYSSRSRCWSPCTLRAPAWRCT